MSLQTFTPTVIPSIGTNGSHEFRVLSANFGDGYAQEAGDGLNTKESVYNIVWSLITNSEFNTITDFFDAHGGHTAFYYTLPGHDSAQKFKCKRYGETWSKGDNKGLTAVFERVYDL